MTPLSLTGKRWLIRHSAKGEGDIVQMLLKQRGIDPLGVGEIPDATGYDAKRFRDCEKAATRILNAIARGEKIGVFGDYDCDGITASAILTRFLRRHGVQPSLRLPHRLKEGYGLQGTMVEEFRTADVTLLLTVDTGVTAVGPIAAARAAGIDVIVLDHHHLPLELPPALAILHPALATPLLDPSPCGAGIAWSLVEELQKRLGDADWQDRGTDIALAAIGTIADVVELTGSNRTLTHSGLLALQQLKHGPLALLCLHAGLTSTPSSRDVAFRIAPRINAAGRMADPHIALSALLGDTDALLKLDALNRERQDIVNAHWDALLPRAKKMVGSALCFVNEDYSPGICGLLAGRLCEAFGKPSLVAACCDDLCTASLRSVPGFHVTEALGTMDDLLLTFGGHAMAAGCSFREDAFATIHERLDSAVRQSVSPDQLTPRLEIDAELTAADVTMALCTSLSLLEPFGQGNPEPRFLIRNVQLDQARRVGSDRKHLQASIGSCKIIGFQLGHLENHVKQPLDVICRIGVDTWRGALAPQLFMDDVGVASAIRPEPVCLPS